MATTGSPTDVGGDNFDVEMFVGEIVDITDAGVHVEPFNRRRSGRSTQPVHADSSSERLCWWESAKRD
jgi:hypothetical protein